VISDRLTVPSSVLEEFCRKWKIRELSVFGSVLRDDFRPDSDVDFVAEFYEDEEWDLFDLMEMREELEGFVGRKVDLLDRVGVETSQNRFLKKEILSTLEPIHAAR
jgi:predicted nucleotidyltransferase